MTQDEAYPKRLCSLPGCGRAHRAKGYCNKHYHSQISRGGIEGKPRSFGPNYHAVKALLEAKVARSDIKRQLGISFQRVSQLAKKIARDVNATPHV